VKKKYNLFLGRYSPPHQGHKALFEKVLNEGKYICVAIRDIEKSENDPYSYRQRKRMLKRLLKEHKDYVKIIKVPDISNVVYGRGVGWGIREIKLDKETESISATRIRNGEM